MIPIRRRLYQSLAGFTPRQLFAALQGAWLEPTPGYIWQENTGINPTTTGGQTIGKIADQSGGGNNASQSTAANRPTYQLDSNSLPLARLDTTDSLSVSLPAINVRRNLLTNTTGPFTNLTAGSYLHETGHPDPLGRPWATKISSITGTSGIVTGGTIVATNTTLTYSVVLKYISGNTARGLAIRNTTTSVSFTTGAVNIQTGVITGTGWTSEPLGDGWYRYKFTQSSGISVGNTIWAYLQNGTLSPLGDWLVAWPQLEAGSTATDYQRVTDWTSEAYASSGSIYFATPVGMSALHNQSMGTSYTLPALSSDIYSWIVVPQRLSTVLEGRLERYMLRKANLPEPDYLLDDNGNQLMSDDYELLLRQ